MCGRISLFTPPERLARIFHAELEPDVDPEGRPSWNVPPTRSILGLVDRAGDGTGPHRSLGRYRWGLVPSWAKDPAVGNRMFNARAETVATKPSFRAAFTARRLAVVADGFYEWQRGPGGERLPYYFTRADGVPLALAGLWEQWWDRSPGSRDRSGGDDRPPDLRTCTVITTGAGPDMTGIHDRMPAVLGTDVLEEWLDPAHRDKPDLESLLVPAVAGTLVRHRVDRRVGNVRNDGPQLVDEVASGP